MNTTPSNTQEGLCERLLLRALLICAPSHQGGHSYTGGEIAEALSIPFPVTMDALRRVATDNGFMPYDLWPWLKGVDDARSALSLHEGG